MTKEVHQKQGGKGSNQANGFQEISEAEIAKWVNSVTIHNLGKLAAPLVAIYDAGTALDAARLRKLARASSAAMLKRIAENATAGAVEGNIYLATTDAYHALKRVFEITKPYHQALDRFMEGARRQAGSKTASRERQESAEAGDLTIPIPTKGEPARTLRLATVGGATRLVIDLEPNATDEGTQLNINLYRHGEIVTHLAADGVDREDEPGGKAQRQVQP